MEREAMASWWVTELERQLEFAHLESQDGAVKATGARVAELLVAERATTAEQELAMVKVHLTETEAVL